MKRRRSSDAVADTPAVLGSSVDELMRHQNSLRVPAIQAIIKLLKELVDIGNNPATVCMKSGSGSCDKNPASVDTQQASYRDISRRNGQRDLESRMLESHHGITPNPQRALGGARRDFTDFNNQEVESQSDDDTEETMDDIPEEDIPTVDDPVHVPDEVMVENEVERSIAIDDADVEMKTAGKRNEVPLMEYILNVCKFLE